jgi:hypothetical protein
MCATVADLSCARGICVPTKRFTFALFRSFRQKASASAVSSWSGKGMEARERAGQPGRVPIAAQRLSGSEPACRKPAHRQPGEGTKQEENSGLAAKNANRRKRTLPLSSSFVFLGKKRRPQLSPVGLAKEWRQAREPGNRVADQLRLRRFKRL